VNDNACADTFGRKNNTDKKLQCEQKIANDNAKFELRSGSLSEQLQLQHSGAWSEHTFHDFHFEKSV